MEQIKTFFSDKEKTNALYPVTKTSAVIDNDGVELDSILDSIAEDVEGLKSSDKRQDFIIDGLTNSIEGELILPSVNDAAGDKKIGSNSFSIARLNSFGGAFKRGDSNHLPEISEFTTTINGITFSYEHNKLRMFGTSTDDNTHCNINLSRSFIYNSSYYIHLRNTGWGSNNAYLMLVGTNGITINEPIYLGSSNIIHRSSAFYSKNIGSLTLGVSGTGVHVDITMQISVEATGEVTPYEPFSKDIITSKVTSIKSIGKNLFDKNRYLDNYGLVGSQTDSSAIVSESSTSCIFYTRLDPGHYTISKDTQATASLSFRLAYSEPSLGVHTTTELHFIGSTPGDFDATETVYLYIEGQAGGVIPVSNIQIEKDAPRTFYVDYSPCTGILQETKIPQEVLELPGYGAGLDSTSYNYISSSDNGKTWQYHQYVGEVILDSLEWERSLYSGSWLFFARLSNMFNVSSSTVTSAVCRKYPSQTLNNILGTAGVVYSGIGQNSTGLVIRDSSVSSVSDLLASLEGQRLVYKLAVPHYQDITGILPKDFGTFAVEDRGYISFEYDTKNLVSVPNNITTFTLNSVTSELENKEDLSNKVQNLNSPSEDTYPSTAAVKTAITQVETSVNTVSVEVSEIADDILNINNSIDELDTDLGTIRSTVQGHDSRISQNSQRIDNITDDIEQILLRLKEMR